MGSLVLYILLIAIMLVSNVLAYLFTEVYTLPIKRKPFTCYGCLSFWLTLGFGSALAFFFNAENHYYVVALILGLANYLFVKSKYKVYE